MAEDPTKEDMAKEDVIFAHVPPRRPTPMPAQHVEAWTPAPRLIALRDWLLEETELRSPRSD